MGFDGGTDNAALLKVLGEIKESSKSLENLTRTLIFLSLLLLIVGVPLTLSALLNLYSTNLIFFIVAIIIMATPIIYLIYLFIKLIIVLALYMRAVDKWSNPKNKN